LPHPGVLHDTGSAVTHKQIIVYRYAVEKKATNITALETNHSQRAVGHYIRDFNRVGTLIEDNKNIAKPVILQYQAIFNQHVKER
jgi:hypothetical protein